jgi:hypothetical protein
VPYLTKLLVWEYLIRRKILDPLIFAVPYLMKLLVWEYLIRRKIRDHEGLQRKYAVELRLVGKTKFLIMFWW